MAGVGFVGLGDQGLPMAVAVAHAGWDLHAWARRPAGVDDLRRAAGGGHAVHTHAETRELAAACDLVVLCVSDDDAVLSVLDGGLLDGLRAGAVVVNHGTGLPGAARQIADRCAAHGVAALDAPVSGGRPAATAGTLVALVGGPQDALERCRPVLDSYCAHVVHLGTAGAGQWVKLFNNALLILNQAAVAEVVGLAAAVGTDPDRLVEALRLGIGSSRALTLLGEMVNPSTVEHLSAVEDVDVDLLGAALAEAGLPAEDLIARAHVGALGLPSLVGALPRVAAAPGSGEAAVDQRRLRELRARTDPALPRRPSSHAAPRP